jgi:hypothetical protein
MMNCGVERMTLTGTEGRGVAQRTLDEAGVLGQRALPTRYQPGVGINNERGVAEPAGVERDVGDVLCRPSKYADDFSNGALR